MSNEEQKKCAKCIHFNCIQPLYVAYCAHPEICIKCEGKKWNVGIKAGKARLEKHKNQCTCELFEREPPLVYVRSDLWT